MIWLWLIVTQNARLEKPHSIKDIPRPRQPDDLTQSSHDQIFHMRVFPLMAQIIARKLPCGFTENQK
jgi:hypothetical protein